MGHGYGGPNLQKIKSKNKINTEIHKGNKNKFRIKFYNNELYCFIKSFISLFIFLLLHVCMYVFICNFCRFGPPYMGHELLICIFFFIAFVLK